MHSRGAVGRAPTRAGDPERLKVGLSTCPNDTFAFHGLLTGAVEARGLELELVLADVQELNEGLLCGQLDVAKGSFHAALVGQRELGVLSAGSAVGRGVGPLVLASRPGRGSGRVLCPGRHTTATLLYRLYHPGEGQLEQVPFSEVMEALLSGEAERGVCIHEARFVWEQHESVLELVEDLGQRWEADTGLPLPLGGILVRPELGEERLQLLADALRDSIAHARAHPREALETMRAHALEQADEVLWAHVELYVTEDTVRLGAQARRALGALFARAAGAGVTGPGRGPLRVFGT